MTYRIKDWSVHFENNRTRDYKRLNWLPVPNKHDGDGYTELMEHENGVAHYGVWMLLAQVASKCDVRGTLLRDGGRPHTIITLARQTRANLRIFEEAIPRLIKIGWLEVLEDNNQELTDNAADNCGDAAVQTRRTELNRTEEEAGEREPRARGQSNFSVIDQANGQSNPNQNQSAEANRPAWEEVWAFAQTIGLAEWKARDWLDEMCAAGWKDWHNREVKSWRHMLTRVCRQWEASGRPMGPPVSANATKGNHANHSTNRQRRIDPNHGTANEGKTGYSAKARELAAQRIQDVRGSPTPGAQR